MNIHASKTVPIEFSMVVEAYRKVKQGGKASGVDGQSWKDFDAKAEDNCYVIWRRLASGSYHPKAVRRVEIPKKDGGKRKLGIPALQDRIAQEVVRHYMEVRVDALFHQHSYGYRPVKSAHEALKQVQSNCLSKDWVIDMDICNFFDEIDHERLLKGVAHLLGEADWVQLYVKRWLEMPVQELDGSQTVSKGKGTPQGGVISPLLANIFLHYTLDVWLSRHYPDAGFVRYADDVIVHCASKERSDQILQAIRDRLQEVGLSLKEEKTKIAYCKDYRRKEEHEHVQFGFLGFSFQPLSLPAKGGGSFTGYGGKISTANESRIKQALHDDSSLRHPDLTFKEVAAHLNPRLRGWFNYYGLFSKYRLNRLAMYVDDRLCRWLREKHKLNKCRSIAKLDQIRQANPRLFYHWSIGLTRIR